MKNHNLVYGAAAVTLTGGYFISDSGGATAVMGAGAITAGEVAFGSSTASNVYLAVGGSKVFGAGTGLNCSVTNKLMVGSNATAPTHTLQLINDDAAKTTTTTWTTTSDRRTKDHITAYTKGLGFLAALPPVVAYVQNGRFGTPAGARGIGFIAQDVEPVAPSWVRRVLAKEFDGDADGSEQAVLKLNTHEHIFALHNAVLLIARHLGLLPGGG